MPKQICFYHCAVLILVSLSALLATACAPMQPIGGAGPDADTAQLTPLKVCYSAAGKAGQSLPFYVSEKGIYAKYGLDVQLINVEGGSNAVAALIAGETDICQVSGPAVVNAVIAGSDLALIAGLLNTSTYYLITTADIQSAADLRGKTLAVSTRGSSTDTATQIALRSLGLRPDEDVTIVTISGAESDRLVAMAAGRIAGTVVGLPMPAQARASGFNKLVDLAATNTPYQDAAFATSRAFLKEHRETALRFLQASSEGVAQMKQDKAGAIAVLAKFMGLDTTKDAALLEAAYSEVVLHSFPDVLYPTAAGVQTILDSLVATNPAAVGFTPADIIDTSLLDEIIKKP